MRSVLLLVGIFGIVVAFQEKNVFHHPRYHPDSRIIHGKEAKPHAFPYTVHLKCISYLYSERCAGSLIAPNVVLTAAHCLEKAIKVEVMLGAHNYQIEEETQIRLTANNFTYHEKWNEDTLKNDIGVIILPQPVEMNEAIQTVKLATNKSNTYADVIANVTGWGKTKESPTDRGSAVLKYLEVRIMNNTECRAVPGYNKVVTDNHMCTDGAGHIGFCDGDSGGPLVTNGVQVGIISFSYRDCEASKPSVYTRVSNYIDWITKNTGIEF